jgi:hypothetical protein
MLTNKQPFAPAGAPEASGGTEVPTLLVGLLLSPAHRLAGA